MNRSAFAMGLAVLSLATGCSGGSAKPGTTGDPSAPASAGPVLDWQDLSLDSSCRLTAGGKVTLRAGQILDTVSGTMGNANDVVASGSGVSGTLKSLVPGVLRATWTATDATGESTASARDVALSLTGEPVFTTEPRSSLLIAGADATAGRQVWFDAAAYDWCGPTAGYRAALAFGMYSACVVSNTRGVLCWGGKEFGLLGDDYPSGSPVPVAVVGLTDVVSLSLGFGAGYALLDDGSPEDGGPVMSWGRGVRHELGRGGTQFSSAPLAVQGLDDAVSLAVGAPYGFECALRANGQPVCWGLNSVGQLGDGTTVDHLLPAPVMRDSSGPLANAVQVTAGQAFACALLSDAAVVCWGVNDYGQLGSGTSDSSSYPVPVVGLSGVISIASGDFATCALLAAGTVKCWGAGTGTTIGADGWPVPSNAPVSVSAPSGAGFLTDVTSIALGGNHACALTRTGTVYCWGDNRDKQLGNGGVGDRSFLPVLVSDIPGVSEPRAPEAIAVAVVAGSWSSCVLVESGLVKCWGPGSYGRLGAGSTCDASVPTTVCTTERSDCSPCPAGEEFRDAAIRYKQRLTAAWSE